MLFNLLCISVDRQVEPCLGLANHSKAQVTSKGGGRMPRHPGMNAMYNSAELFDLINALAECRDATGLYDDSVTIGDMRAALYCEVGAQEGFAAEAQARGMDE